MKKILIVEGNLKEENTNFSKAGIQTHTQSLKDSLAFLTNELALDVVNPSSDQNIRHFNENLHTYDGLIWGGSSLNIYSNTPEIKRQLEFMKECQNKIKNILAICWGMQVAVTVAGGEVKKCSKGAHRGIAHNIEINQDGLKHPLYKNKNKIFNTPAFNFDEVVTLPNNATLLASNSLNKVMGTTFVAGMSNIWGIQYHPEITYSKMISLIRFRRDRLLSKKAFKDDKEIESHINVIEKESKISEVNSRMQELKNWINYLNEN